MPNMFSSSSSIWKNLKNWGFVKHATPLGKTVNSYKLYLMYLLFDIGGTKTRLAISRDGENFMSFEIKDTPEDFESGITMFGEYVKSQGIGIQKVVGGIAGVLNSEKTTLTFSPNLARWIGKNLKSSLSRIVGTKEVYLENDAALDGLGEAVFGSGKGARIVAFITVSTGVGGARIVNKRIDVSNYGFEPGHQILEVGQKGLIDLEGLIGGASIQKKYNISPMDLKDDNIWKEIYHHLRS